MVNLNKFRKDENYKPSYDSDGGGDYVNSTLPTITDPLNAEKFNYRWNKNDEWMIDIEKNFRSSRKNKDFSKLLSFLENPENFDKELNEIPFFLDYSGSSLQFAVNGYAGVIASEETNNIKVPLSTFIDFMDKDNDQYSLKSGGSYIHGIFDNYGSGGDDTFYRIGHDGTEPPQSVAVSKASIASTWSQIGFIFEDYLNAPATLGKGQVIEFTSTLHNEYIYIVSDGTFANYEVGYALWNGASLDTGSVSSGVARSAAKHNVVIECNNNGTLVKIDGVTYVNLTSTMERVDEIEFQSNNDTGTADFFDIFPISIYNLQYLTATAGNINYVYLDLDTYIFGISTTIPTGNKLVFYVILLETGVTGIVSDDITDFRKLLPYTQNAIFTRNIISSNGDYIIIESLNKHRIIYIFSVNGLNKWESTQQDYDHLILMNEIVLSESISITEDYIIIEGGVFDSSSLSYALEVSGDHFTLRNVQMIGDTTTANYIIRINNAGKSVIRNCTFKDGSNHHIYIQSATDVLITENTFIVTSGASSFDSYVRIDDFSTNTNLVCIIKDNTFDSDGPGRVSYYFDLFDYCELVIFENNTETNDNPYRACYIGNATTQVKWLNNHNIGFDGTNNGEQWDLDTPALSNPHLFSDESLYYKKGINIRESINGNRIIEIFAMDGLDLWESTQQDYDHLILMDTITLDETITITADHVTIEGGKLIVDDDSNKRLIIQSEYFTIRDVEFNLDGYSTGTSSASTSALEISATNGAYSIVIDNCKFIGDSSTNGTGIWITSSTAFTNIDSKIMNCHFNTIGKGIHISNAEFITFTNNSLISVGTAIYTTLSNINVTISNNSSSECGSFINSVATTTNPFFIIESNTIKRTSTSGTALTLLEHSNSVVQGNTIFNYTTGISLQFDCDNIVIANNVINNGNVGISFASGGGIHFTINGNTIINRTTGILINSNCEDNIISGNNIELCSVESITITGTSIANNLCVGNIARDGITGEDPVSTGNIVT
jgi:hypothetical protein